MKMNILEKWKPVKPIKEEDKVPEDVPGRNNSIPKSPEPAAVECTHINYRRSETTSHGECY
jgi:hypothetical protein